MPKPAKNPLTPGGMRRDVEAEALNRDVLHVHASPRHSHLRTMVVAPLILSKALMLMPSAPLRSTSVTVDWPRPRCHALGGPAGPSGSGVRR